MPCAEELPALLAAELAARPAEAYRLIGELAPGTSNWQPG